jgi:hypothetical protein
LGRLKELAQQKKDLEQKSSKLAKEQVDKFLPEWYPEATAMRAYSLDPKVVDKQHQKEFLINLTNELKQAVDASLNRVSASANKELELAKVMSERQTNPDVLNAAASHMAEAERRADDLRENAKLIPDIALIIKRVREQLEREDKEIPELMPAATKDLKERLKELKGWESGSTPINEVSKMAEMLGVKSIKRNAEFNILDKKRKELGKKMEEADKKLDQLGSAIGVNDDKRKLDGELRTELNRLRSFYASMLELQYGAIENSINTHINKIEDLLKMAKNPKPSPEMTLELQNVKEGHDKALEERDKKEAEVKAMLKTIEDKEKALVKKTAIPIRTAKKSKGAKERLKEAKTAAKAGDMATANILIEMAENEAKQAEEVSTTVKLDNIEKNWEEARRFVKNRLLNDENKSILALAKKDNGLELNQDQLSKLTEMLKNVFAEIGGKKYFSKEVETLMKQIGNEKDAKDARIAREQAQAKVNQMLRLIENDPRFKSLQRNKLGAGPIFSHMSAMLRKYDYLFSVAVPVNAGESP